MGLTIKKEDTVMVITGKEKGKKGRVLRVMPDKGRLTVEKINMIKKHMKPNRQFSQGGILDKEGTLELSNVMLVCPRCSKPTRINNLILDTGKKLRQCKKCKEVID